MLQLPLQACAAASGMQAVIQRRAVFVLLAQPAAAAANMYSRTAT
jgi:hypothetical protein